MRVVFIGLLLLSLVGACTAERGLAPQTATAPPTARMTASNTVVASRAVLWVVDGQVLGRAADPSLLTGDQKPLDARLIESIEVLKSKAAVAEFGEAGEAGAIIVRTRQFRR